MKVDTHIAPVIPINQNLIKQGKANMETPVEYSVHLYYTTEVMRALKYSDPVQFGAEQIALLNLGYEQSKIPVKAKLFRMDHLKDFKESFSTHDMLHKFVLRKLPQNGDVTVLLTAGGNYCGYSVGPSKDSILSLGVVRMDCAKGKFQLAHQIGHIFGAEHDQDALTEVPVEPYGKGQLFCDCHQMSPGYTTIMGVPKPCYKRRYNVYSSPDPAVGISPICGSTGDAQSSDNSRLLTERRFLMASLGDEQQQAIGIVYPVLAYN